MMQNRNSTRLEYVTFYITSKDQHGTAPTQSESNLR